MQGDPVAGFRVLCLLKQQHPKSGSNPDRATMKKTAQQQETEIRIAFMLRKWLARRRNIVNLRATTISWMVSKGVMA